MSSVPEIAVQNLDHLGLVAGLIDEIGIVEKINQIVGEKPGEIGSPASAMLMYIIIQKPLRWNYSLQNYLIFRV